MKFNIDKLTSSANQPENNGVEQKGRPVVLVSDLKLTELFKPLLESKSFESPIRYLVENQMIYVFMSEEHELNFEKIEGKPLYECGYNINENEVVMDYLTFFHTDSSIDHWKDIRDSVEDHFQVRSIIEENTGEDDSNSIVCKAKPISDEDMAERESQI